MAGFSKSTIKNSFFIVSILVNLFFVIVHYTYDIRVSKLLGRIHLADVLFHEEVPIFDEAQEKILGTYYLSALEQLNRSWEFYLANITLDGDSVHFYFRDYGALRCFSEKTTKDALICFDEGETISIPVQ
jgi:hypothetical protein